MFLIIDICLRTCQYIAGPLLPALSWCVWNVSNKNRPVTVSKQIKYCESSAQDHYYQKVLNHEQRDLYEFIRLHILTLSPRRKKNIFANWKGKQRNLTNGLMVMNTCLFHGSCVLFLGLIDWFMITCNCSAKGYATII